MRRGQALLNRPCSRGRNARYRFDSVRPGHHFERLGRVDVTMRQCADSTMRQFDEVPARRIPVGLFL
jgi:hypothetical protein